MRVFVVFGAVCEDPAEILGIYLSREDADAAIALIHRDDDPAYSAQCVAIDTETRCRIALLQGESRWSDEVMT